MLTSLRQTTREFPRVYSLKKAFVALLLIVLAVSSVAAYSILPAQAKTVATSNSKFNQNGNILITDQFNNRVIEIAPDGSIVWQFGNGPGDTSANAIVGTNDAERVGSLTLMSGTGIPPWSYDKLQDRLCRQQGSPRRPKRQHHLAIWHLRSHRVRIQPAQYPSPEHIPSRRKHIDHRPGQRADHRGSPERQSHSMAIRSKHCGRHWS